MNVYVHIASGATTFNSRYSEEELAGYSVRLTEEDAAEIICGESIEKLVPYLARFGAKKKWLVWCDEPLWSTIWYKLTAPLVYWSSVENKITSSEDPLAVPINVMNCFTGDVFTSNKMFITDEYEIKEENITSIKGNYGRALKTAAFLTFRSDEIFNLNHQRGVMGLSCYRSQLALELHRIGLCDIFGPNWADGVAIYNDRLVKGVYHTNFSKKIEDLKNYKFCFALENTIAPHYVTEKIWQAIVAGCLPIYYAGRSHTIYEDFPEDSFIDFALLSGFDELCEIINTMKEDEYNKRIRLCQDVLVRCARESGFGKFPQKIQLQILQNKLEFISAN